MENNANLSEDWMRFSGRVCQKVYCATTNLYFRTTFTYKLLTLFD